MIKINYSDPDDILHIEFSNEPIVKDVSHGWNVNVAYAANGIAEITILDAKAKGFWPIHAVGVSSGMAEAIVEAQQETLSDSFGTTVATKKDVEIAVSNLKIEMSELKSYIAASELRMTIKIGTMFAAGVGVIIAAMKLFI